VKDYERLADLSHTIDRMAVSLCREDTDDRRIERYLVEMSEGEREAVAVALSYALRRRELEGSTPINDRTVAALANAVRRMTNPVLPGDPGDDKVR
jgi:hypothetical protein